MTFLKNRIFFILNIASKLYGDYKWQILLLAIFGLVAGFLESIGIGILIPIFSLAVGRDAASGNDAISIYVSKIFNYLGLSVSLPLLFTLIIGLFIFKSIVSLIFSYISTKITLDFETTTRKYLYRKALLSSWPYLLKQKIGYLENTIMMDLIISGKALVGISALILDITGLVMYIFVAFNISRFITVVTLLFGSALILVLYPLMSRTRKNAKKQSSLSKVIANHINEHFIGIKSIKASGIENSVAERGDKFYDGVRIANLRQSMTKNLIGSIMSPMSMVFIAVVFLMSYSRPTFNLAVFAATMYLIQRIFIHLNAMQKNLHVINDFSPHLINVVNLKEQIEKNQEDLTGTQPFKFNKELKFENVSFSYEGSKKVLESITFRINKGEMTGIIGPSGSGKTTLVDLMLRLFSPQDGKIIIDSENIKNIKIDEWRKNISYVAQDAFLLNDTISNNIRFYDQDISDEDIKSAAKAANIFDFIMGLDNGFDTPVGERGVMLSGGQKQRISLARALARKPALLILDEATSALDNESEVLIQKAIENLKHSTTVVAIAHRLSTIMNADRLIVLDEGKVREIGAPIDLLNDKNSYFHKVNAK